MKRLFTLGVVLTTILWTMGVAAFVPVAAAAAIVPGDLIKASGPAVYYYAANGERYTFPTESTYKSWYANFDGVVTIDDDELSAIDLAGNVVVRAGTNLIKIDTVNKVYAVSANGVLRHIEDEAAAKALYGDDWAMKIVTIPDGFWTNYTDSDTALDGTAFPAGQLVSPTDSANTYYVNADGSWSLVADETAFNANKWMWDDVVETALTMPSTGTAISTAMYNDVSQGGGAGDGSVTPATGGALTVSLSASSPAANTLPEGVAVVFSVFNFSAGSKDVNISSLKLTAVGLGDSTEIDSVTLYDAGSKVGTSKNINSDRYANFNFSTPITVTAGTSKDITAKAKLTIAAAGSGYYGLGIAAAADVTSTASSVGGTFPVNGATMYGADGSVAVGTLTFDADDNDITSKVGEDDVIAVEFTAAASSTEDINFSGLTLKNNGNMKGSEAGTLTLYHDADPIATATLDGNKYATWSFDAITIKKGETENFKVMVDIEAGDSGDTLQLYIKDDTDFVATGGSYGYQVQVTRSAFDTDDGDSTLITLAAGALTINFDKTAVPAANILKDTDNIVAGKLDIIAGDEAVKVTALSMTVGGAGYTDGEIENVELVDIATGGIIDTNTFTSATGVATWDEEIYLAKGETKSYNLRYDTTTTADDGDVYSVTLASGGVTAEGETSGATVTDITPSSVVSRNMTVVFAAVTHAVVTIGAQTTIGGSNDIIVYKSTLKASQSSDVKITKAIFSEVASNNDTTFADADVTSLSLVIGDSIVKTQGNKIAEATGSANTVTFEGLAYELPAGETQTMYLKANFAGTLTNSGSGSAFNIEMTGSAFTAKDELNKTVTITPDTANGPTVTVNATGYLDVNVSLTETDANRAVQVLAGNTSDLLGTFKFNAQNEAVKVIDLVLGGTIDDDTLAEDVARVELIDSDKATVLASSQEFAYSDLDTSGTSELTVTFDDWNYVVPEAGIKKIYVRVVTDEIGNQSEQTGTSNTAIAFGISSITAEGAQSGNSMTFADNAVPSTADALNYFEGIVTAGILTNSAYNMGAVITSITNDMANGVLTNGSAVIGKFAIGVENGNNTDVNGEETGLNLQDVLFTTNHSGVVLEATPDGTDFNVYWASDPNTKVAATGFTDADANIDIDLAGLASITSDDVLVIEAADISGAGGAGDYVQIKFADLDSNQFEWDSVPTGDTNATTVNGVWLDYTEVIGATLSN